MSDHYYTKKPTSVIKETQFEATARGVTCSFTTASGLFSLDFLDKGSEVLLNFADLNNATSVLDLGCGYGPVGIFIQKAEKTIAVTATDVNERAVLYTKKNAKANDVSLTAFQSEGFENIDAVFDVILLNPPQSAGKKVCEQLIAQAKTHLNRGGSLQIVARAKKGGKALSEFMESVYGNVEVLKRKSGFSVYKSVYN